MAVYDNSALTNTIIPMFDMKLLEGRYASAIIMPRVLNKSDSVREKGSQVQISIEPVYTTGTVTSGTGAFTPLATAPTNVNVVVNVWSYVAVELTSQAEIQSFWDPKSTFPARAGAALAVEQDVALGALYSSLTGLTAIGTEENPVAFGPDAAKTAMLRMADANVPLTALSWILPPIGFFKGWLDELQLTAANSMGVPKNVLTTGYQSNILGAPMYLSTVVATSGNKLARKGLLLHKEALAIATQRDHEYALADKRGSGYLGKVGVVDSLYGVRAVRTDHAVVINIQAG